MTLGSVDLDADPDDIGPGLRLRPGVSLGDAERQQLSVWLRIAGDASAAMRRRVAKERIEVRVRAEVLAKLSETTGDEFERAVAALNDVAVALPGLAEDMKKIGSKGAWTVLRPRYLAIHAAWERLVESAQAAGVARKAKRTARRA
jgi:hypothetical protein